MNMVAFFEKRDKPFWGITGIVLIIGLGIIDFLTGYELSFSLFYLFPISLVTWYTGRRLGVVASIVSAITWLTADIASGHHYSNPGIYYWNSMIRFGFFIIVALLLSAHKTAHEREKELARKDNLTGAFNARFFSELLQMEIERSQRYKHPLTIAYFDLDNFKTVNDQFGHGIGDQVLYTVVNLTKRQLRKIDIVGRLGGDEFAFILPETDQVGAQVVISKIQKFLLDEMNRNNWPVTFSVGVLTCVDTPSTSEGLLKRADELMYSVKNSGKNAITYSAYPG
jgi:diguanylate cyclase (GGDEF)-like protein